MNAAVKTKKPSAAELRAVLGEQQAELEEAQNREARAKAQLTDAVAQGDAEAQKEARAEIKRCRQQIEHWTDEVEATSAAIAIAQNVETGRARARAHADLTSIHSAVRDKVEALEESLDRFAEAVIEAMSSIEACDAEHVKRGLPAPDPMLIRAKLQGMTDRRLHWKSLGRFGKANSLDSPHQLELTGNASLKRLAENFVAVTLRNLDNRLGRQA